MIQVSAIAAVLGGPKSLKRRVTSEDDLRRAVEAGLPVGVLAGLTRVIAFEGGPERRALLMGHIAPPATLKRRKRGKTLRPIEGERAVRLARVYAQARFAFDDDALARRFLFAPHRELGGDSPAARAGSDIGARQVETILWSLVHGLPA
jgi:putative toxin-antitoxin system antitoxin component (TIGR02293 family)